MELTEEELAVVLSPTVFPNDAWPTEADVPLGVVVNDGGVIKKSRYVGNFDGEDELNFPLTKSMYNIPIWEFEICGTFNPSSTAYAPIYQDSNTINGGVFNCVLVLERNASTSKLNIFYSGDQVRYTTVSDIFDGYHKIKLVRNLDTTISVYVDGVLDGATGPILTTMNTSAEIQIGSKVESRRPNMEISSCTILGETFPFTEGEGSTVTGNQGTVANIIDLTPTGFWLKTLVPV